MNRYKVNNQIHNCIQSIHILHILHILTANCGIEKKKVTFSFFINDNKD